MKKSSTYEDRLSILKSFLEESGIDSQKKMAIEEMSELTKELCKTWRFGADEADRVDVENVEEIRGEIADVLIMATQLKIFYGEVEIEKIIDYKINRHISRIAQAKAEQGNK
jgi:hypothetical protein